MNTATIPTLSGTVKADCGCIGTVRHQTRLAVYVHVTVPCEQGHPERVAAGVLWPFPPSDVHEPTAAGAP